MTSCQAATASVNVTHGLRRRLAIDAQGPDRRAGTIERPVDQMAGEAAEQGAAQAAQDEHGKTRAPGASAP